MKIVSFIRQTPPSNYSLVFNDPVTVVNDDIQIGKTPFGRSMPNAIKPGSGRIWDMAYGVIALGTYNAVCIQHEKHGKCLRIADGREIPAAMPNINHGMRHVVSGALVHSSDTETWPGSAACLTIKKSEWKAFIALFSIGETVKVEIRGL